MALHEKASLVQKRQRFFITHDSTVIDFSEILNKKAQAQSGVFFTAHTYRGTDLTFEEPLFKEVK